MDNNNYEQEFIKSIKQTKQPASSSRPAPKPTSNPSTLPMVVAIILGIIVLVESVALTVFAVNYGVTLDLYGDEGFEYDADSSENVSEEDSIQYDEDYNIVAFDLDCVAEDDSRYTFTKSGSYQKTDNNSNLLDSGTYSVINDAAVALKSASQGNAESVYYDGYNIVEGVTFYDCLGY